MLSRILEKFIKKFIEVTDVFIEFSVRVLVIPYAFYPYKYWLPTYREVGKRLSVWYTAPDGTHTGKMVLQAEIVQTLYQIFLITFLVGLVWYILYTAGWCSDRLRLYFCGRSTSQTIGSVNVLLEYAEEYGTHEEWLEKKWNMRETIDSCGRSLAGVMCLQFFPPPLIMELGTPDPSNPYCLLIFGFWAWLLAFLICVHIYLIVLVICYWLHLDEESYWNW